MSFKYSEVYKPSPNQSGRIKPRFIVLHHSLGSWSGDQSWIKNAKSGVSYHYLVNRDGRRVQFVHDTRKAWHAGKSYWLGFSGLNSRSIGLAVTGNTNKRDLEDDELESVCEVIRYLMRKFSISADRIITHQMISPRRKTDVSMRVYQQVIRNL